MTGNKPKILVVDDEDAARYSVVRALRGMDCEILEATTGKDTLRLAKTVEPDLVVLDVRLPDMLGFDVAQQLRSDEITRSIAILQTSASFTEADAQARGLRSGADAYITHPVEPQVLVATVQSLLRMRSAEQIARAERGRAEEARAVAEAERVRAEEEKARAEAHRTRAEASERRYRFLADMLPQLVWSTDAEGNPDYFNRRWFEFAGTSPDEEQSKNWLGALHPHDRERFEQAWNHCVQSGDPLEVECRRWSQPANAFRWLLIRALPMRDGDGRITRWFGTSTDIEAQKQALAERDRLLQQARETASERDKLVEKLREESRRKNEFLAILSHELRNPLAPIRNSLYVIGHAAANGEQAKRAVEVIDRQIGHMTRLVDDLLDVTRIARGKIRLQTETVELNALIKRSAEDHRSLLKRAGLELELRLLEQPLVVQGDPTRLSQVIGNLLQNAAKFTPSGGCVSLWLSLESPSHAVVRVCDTGTGIEPRTLNHLFEPFVQGDNTLDRSKGGLGLGLALAKGVVELHGGTIAAASEGAGKGAQFTVRLPLDKRVSGPLSVVREDRDGRGPCRVLVIEDLDDSAESLRQVLELSGHVAAVASDGPKGLALARTFEPDVILCDIGLPVMDGYEVAGEIRKDPALAGAYLVALSGYALQEDIARSKDAGFDDHMAKPVRFDYLERLLARVSRERESRRELG